MQSQIDRIARPLVAVIGALAGVALLCNPPFSPLHLVWRGELPARMVGPLTAGFLLAPAGTAVLAILGGRWIWRASTRLRRGAALAVAAVLALTLSAFVAAGQGWHF